MSKCIVPAFHVIRLSTGFANPAMRFGREDQWVRFPKIAEAATALIRLRNLFPKFAARFFTPVANDKCHDLPCPAAHGCPQPTLVFPRQNERPDFVQLKLVIDLGGHQRVGDRLQACGFFLAKPRVSAVRRQTFAQCHAYSDVHGRRQEFALFLLQCRAQSD